MYVPVGEGNVALVCTNQIVPETEGTVVPILLGYGAIVIVLCDPDHPVPVTWYKFNDCIFPSAVVN